MRSKYTFDVENGLVFSNYRKEPIGSFDGRYLSIKINGKKVYIHRMIWEHINGKIPDGMVVDHIDGDKLNNKISNLRIGTQEQNCQNNKLKKCFSVDKRGRKKKFRAQIIINGKSHTKSFYTKEEAVDYYIKTKKEKHSFFNGETNVKH